VRRSDLPAKNDNAVFLMDRGGWFAGKPGSYRSGLARQTKTPDLRRPGVFVCPAGIRTDWLASMEPAQQSGLQQVSEQSRSSPC
jgi:hypothetical protein